MVRMIYWKVGSWPVDVVAACAAAWGGEVRRWQGRTWIVVRRVAEDGST